MPFTATPQRQRTTIKGPLKNTGTVSKTNETTASHPFQSHCDTITANTDNILHLTGYDKPVSASRETMHVSNTSDSLTVTGMNIEIRYLDKRGRELHRRDISIYNTVEPGCTELISFPSWDIQRSFYYMLSIKPRRQATPYDIRCKINYLIVTKHTQ